MDNISHRITYYRRKKGLTQMDVATALGMRTDNYSKYETGARTPKEDRVIALAKILGVSYNTLVEGVEREFAGLLSRHAISAVLGDVESFDAFPSDMELSSEAYYVVAEFFNRGVYNFRIYDTTYREYMEKPDLRSLISLYGIYRKHYLSRMSEPATKKIMTVEEYLCRPLKADIAAKWAFCSAVYNYMKNSDAESILLEAEKLSENWDELQFFAVKVFVPYLSLIIDAVELCVNTTIDDFEKAFFYNALTPPTEDIEIIEER